MSEIKIKALMDWKCPYCGLFGKGTLNMNGKAMEWLDAAWKAHIQECRDEAAKFTPEAIQSRAEFCQAHGLVDKTERKVSP